jgi:hypothetical protein
MGSVTIAFDADNPGRWAFHCHNLYHMVTGMMIEVRYPGACYLGLISGLRPKSASALKASRAAHRSKNRWSMSELGLGCVETLCHRQ